MLKGVVVFVMLLALISAADSISIKDLLARYNFSASSAQMDLISSSDFMIDDDNNGVNDTLVIELITIGTGGEFIFVANLEDQHILTAQLNKSLTSGINKLNLTFDSMYLAQNEFNYSIKAYNSTHSLKFRKDKIPTSFYSGYEKAFEIISVDDYRDGKTLIVNITLNSSKIGAFDTILFLHYNNSAIFERENKSIQNSLQSLAYEFDNETIKRTHITGNFNISLRIGNRIFKLNQSQYYDFTEFAASPYILGFTDGGIDTDLDGKYDVLRISADVEVMQDNYYSLIAGLYDSFGSVIGIKNEEFFLNSGGNSAALDFNGSGIYSKKLNGPFTVEYAKFYENGTIIDGINSPYITKYYDFDDFNSPNMPDLKAFITASDAHHYGINNATINISFKNIGTRHAFNIITEIFDNNSLHLLNKSSVMAIGSDFTYQINATNFSDFELTALADADDFEEESDETNNGGRLVMRLNHKPELNSIADIIVNATKKAIINLSASDSDGDSIIFSFNLSKFSKNTTDGNNFEWNTVENDSGEYSLMATASDGFLSDSEIFMVTIINISKNASDNDLDKDGIPDDIDRLIGNQSSINTTTLNLTVYINGSSNLSRAFNKSLNVKFLDGKLPILEFDFDFSKNTLNLTRLTINKQLPKQKGSLVIKGLKLQNGAKKTAYVDRIKKFAYDICIKDQQVSSINEISARCNRKDEFKVSCSFTRFFRPKAPYTCTYLPAVNKFKVQNLNHSGIVQV